MATSLTATLGSYVTKYAPKYATRAAIGVALIASTGCTSLVYKVAGDGVLGFGKDQMLPYLLSTDDTHIGCVSGEALTPLMLSFGNVTTPPDDLAVLVHMVGGGCASQSAAAHELNYIRLAKEQRAEAAKDARIEAKRWHGIAAQRFNKGYKALVRHAGEIGEACPTFADEQEQLVWILGTAVTLQAVMADSLSGNVVGVPLDAAPKAERAAACLDNPEGNQKWWGLPKAIRAVLWSVVPGLGPSDSNKAWQEMDNAMTIGEQQGVRMSFALTALAAYNAGKTDISRQVLKRYATSVKRIAPNREYRLVDVMANDLLVTMSDRMWTEATGHRTPLGKLGHFWDEQKATPSSDADIDDLL